MRAMWVPRFYPCFRVAAAVVGLCVPLRCLCAAASGERADVVAEIRQKLADAPGESLTARVLELAPGSSVAVAPHSNVVFAVVLSGAVRLRQSDGAGVDQHSGDSWVEPAGAARLRLENASVDAPARVLDIFVASSEPARALAER